MRRLEAKRYASDYLWPLGKPMEHRPELEFAIAIEAHIPIFNNPVTGKTEAWDAILGRWLPDAANTVKGEDIADPLRATFKKIVMKFDAKDDSFKPTSVPFDDSLFTTNGMLGAVASQAGCLKFGREWPALDASEESNKIRVFKGGLCLDFNIELVPGEPITLEAMYRVLRPSRKEDRISRCCPTTWKDYENPCKMELFNLLQRAEACLNDNDILDDDIRLELDAASKHHDCLRCVFFEAHGDWDEAIFCLKMLANTVNGKSYGRCEHYTMFDDGCGSTSKGTIRELFEALLGTFTGSEQRGYCGVLSRACLQEAGKAEQGVLRPNEQMSNLKGSCLGWLDDFQAKGNPLSAEKLRQISGGNSLTSARKNKGEETFKFNGTLVMMCNGLWTIEGTMAGADLRRFARQQFLVTFQNDPVGPMQKQKDKAIKGNVVRFLPELWWLIICYHHIKQAHDTKDRTLPLPPTAVAALAELLNETSDDKFYEACTKFVAEKLIDYQPQEALARSAADIEKALEWYCATEKLERPTDDELRKGLRRHLMYKAGIPMNKFGSRKRTTVNGYLKDGKVVTLP